MKVCRKCEGIFGTHEQRKSIKCSGSCSGEFHNMCTNLNENEVTSLKLSTNIKWLCDDCSKSFGEMKSYRNMNIKDININLQPKQMATRIKMFIFVLVILALLITIVIFGSIMIRNKNCGILFGKGETITNINGGNVNDESECSGTDRLCLIDRNTWEGQPQKPGIDKQVLPLHRVIIAHTATDGCLSLKLCAERVRLIQEFHMYALGYNDIAYNFLIGGDGRVYVGRGWNMEGAHTKGYNNDSVGIAFIGTYVKTAPTDEQLIACQVLLEEGVRLKKLSADYRLYGVRQLSGTESPGITLYNIINKWPHWSAAI